MTLNEIRAAYPEQYVVLDDVLLDERTRGPRAGRVIANGPTRRAVFAAAPKATPDSHWALEFTGKVRVPPGFVGLFSAK